MGMADVPERYDEYVEREPFLPGRNDRCEKKDLPFTAGRGLFFKTGDLPDAFTGTYGGFYLYAASGREGMLSAGRDKAGAPVAPVLSISYRGS